MRSQVEEGVRELERLERLIDGVFALIIVLIVLNLPQPQDYSAGALREFMLARLSDGVGILIGCAVVSTPAAVDGCWSPESMTKKCERCSFGT